MRAWIRFGSVIALLMSMLSEAPAATVPPLVNDFEVELFGRYWRVQSYFVQDDLLQNSAEDTFLEPEGLVCLNGFLYASGDRESDETDSRLARYTYSTAGPLLLDGMLQMPNTSPDWWGPEGLTTNNSASGYGSSANAIVSVERDTGETAIIDTASGAVANRLSVGAAEDLTFLPGRQEFAVLLDSGTSISVIFRDNTMTATGQQFTVAAGTNGLVGVSAAFGSWFTRTNQTGEVLLAVTKANPGNAILAYNLAGSPIGVQQGLPLTPKAWIPLGGQFYMLLPAFGTIEAVTVDEANKVVFIGDESNTMIHVLTPGSPTADFDRDGDVDIDDLDWFDSCASGAGVARSAECTPADFDSDGDVDQIDFGLFQLCLSGEGVDADPTCAD